MQNIDTANKLIPRNYSISLIRAMATISIVLCHIFQYYGIELAWWFNVGVEIFLVISGFLYGKKEINDPLNFIINNIKKILVPYIIWMIITIVIYVIFARGKVGLFDILYPLVYGDTLPGLSHLWFVPYILFCYILTPFLYQLKTRIKTKEFYLVIGILAVTLLISYQHYEFPRICCYIIGYFIGAKLNDKKHLMNVTTFWFALIAILINAVRIYFKYIGTKEMLGNLESLFMAFESFGHTMLGIALFLLLYSLFSSLKIKANPILSFMDKYSYEIYLTHHIFILSSISLLSATEFGWLNICLVIVFTIISSLILKLLSQKIMKLINLRMVQL